MRSERNKIFEEQNDVLVPREKNDTLMIDSGNEIQD